jgi:hypothetical protein
MTPLSASIAMSTAEPRAHRVGRKPERAAGGLTLRVLPPPQAALADFPDDRYLVSVERAADPGGREWVTEKTGVVVALRAAPPAAVRVHWIAPAR